MPIYYFEIETKQTGTSAKTMGTLGKDHVVVTVTYKDGRKEIALNTWV